MSTRKHISVNLRDLQRVMADDEQQKSSATTEKSKFGATKTFEYKISSSRWGNEVDDDDFDNLYTDKKVEAEPDFSSLRKQTVNVVRKPTGDTWRTATSASEKTSTNDTWRSSKDKGDNKNNRSKEFFTRETVDEEEKKLYVPPRSKRTETVVEKPSEPVNDRFSCLGDTSRDYDKPSDDRKSKDDSKEVYRPRDDWGTIEETKTRDNKSTDVYRESRQSSDRFKDDTKESLKDRFTENEKSTLTTGSSNKGLFVPSYKKAQKADNVEDIFKKAAGIKEVDYDKGKKDVTVISEQYNQALMLKRNEIVKYNRQFKCSEECIESVIDVVESLLNGENIDNFNDIIDSDDIKSLVPIIVSCLVVAKNCEGITNIEDVHNKFNRTSKWIGYLLDNSDESYRIKLLTEIAKFINHWNYPILSESLYLIEAIFDSLYKFGLIKHEDFINWFDHDVDEIPNRLTVLIQLISWKKWLDGEIEDDEDVAEDEELDDEDDEDIDIEALVPKPVRLTKGLKY